MAAYAQPSDVRLLINTEKTDAQLTALIAETDYDLDSRLNGYSMDATIKKFCSSRLAAIIIAQSQRGIYSDKPENKSTAEWQSYVDGKVEDAKKGGTRKPKIYSTTQLYRSNCGLL